MLADTAGEFTKVCVAFQMLILYIPYAQPNSTIISTFKSNFNNVPLIQDKEILYFYKYFLPSKMYQFTQVLKNSIVYFIASELNFTTSHITLCLWLFLERLSEIMCTRKNICVKNVVALFSFANLFFSAIK